jgi:GNAT superfamily N-acetyltransferase
MIFASTELAARIEKAEARLLAELARALLRRDDPGNVFVEPVAGGIAVYAGPESPVNKLIGIGFDTIPDDDQLDKVEEMFRGRSAPVRAAVSSLAASALGAHLGRRGYILQCFEHVLGRSVGPVEAPAPNTVQVRLIEPVQADEWLGVIVAGFLTPDTPRVAAVEAPAAEEFRKTLLPFLFADGFRRYLAYLDGKVAGAAVMRIDDGLAQMCGATTLPEYRRRGVQSALFSRRLADAKGAGCDLAVMSSLPGSKSQQNGQRVGFELLYSRSILVKEC